MSIKLDCQHFVGDSDCNRCSIMGYIFDCPADCEEYKDFFGRQPCKIDLEKQLRGEA
jgi:hypothetical protein